MGYRVLVYKCEECQHEWDVLTEPDEPPPESCPRCTEQEVTGPIPSTTSIGGSALSQSVTKMYADLEKTSAWRAEQANDPSLKITNLKDNFYGGGTRQGDVVAPQVNNPVTQYAEAAGSKYWSEAPGGVTVENIMTNQRARGGKAAGSVGLAAVQNKVAGQFNKIPPRR